MTQAMITVYHRVDSDSEASFAPLPGHLELVALVTATEDLDEAFDYVIHRDGENWTHDPAVTVIGSPRGKRSTQEGDVFVTQDGLAYLVLPLGFRHLPTLRLPCLPG
jgi:hypothetical protein